MNYYEVWVSGATFHDNAPLTYESEEALKPGVVVTVPLQKRDVLGIVHKEAPKPAFATKPLKKVATVEPLPEVSLRLFAWLREYYPAPLGSLISLFLPAGLAQTSRLGPIKPLPKKPGVTMPPLTKEQLAAMTVIKASANQTVLLHGDTGTGKTRVYLELAAEQLKAGKSVIALTPEIGLTPQLAEAFSSAFPGQVAVLHSTLTPAARRDQWLRVLTSKEPLVVIGPRSALFSPVKNLGLIIIDEAHDSAYKQEQAPYYQTTRVAAKLAALHQVMLLMGTATPLISDYYALQSKGLPIVRMQEQAVRTKYPKPEVEIVDLKERSAFSRSSWLSNQLLDGIGTALANKGQSLVFLNRRGTARLVLCQNCGWMAACPRCDLPLTYHGDRHDLRCHTCGYKDSAPSVCPDCSSADIVYKSVGTKTLQAELERLFKGARVMRFDSDTHKDDSLETVFQEVYDGKVDILVGTQMLAKGLDLPSLEMLGVVVADTSLSFPDYTAEERTFQMLTQIFGRVGRGHRRARVVVQTYAPDSPIITAALKRDYESFYQSHIKERQAYHFPPFRYLLKLSCARATSPSAAKAANELFGKLARAGLPIEITGPSPSFVEKNNDKYRWQLVIRAKERGALLQVIKLLPANWTYDLDPSNLL